MSQEKRKVQVHYRRLSDRNFQSLKPSFQACLEEALKGRISGVGLSESDSARLTTTSDKKRMCLLSPTVYKNNAVGEIAVFKDGGIPVAKTDDQGQLYLGPSH